VVSVLRVRAERTWLLFGLFGGLAVYVLSPIGLALAVGLLVVAVTASVRTPFHRVAPAYLVGFGIVGLPLTIALAVASGESIPFILAGFSAALLGGLVGLVVGRNSGDQTRA
jgi:hypothetical protein